MLRIFGNTTVFAVALCAVGGLGLCLSPRAWTQEVADVESEMAEHQEDAVGTAVCPDGAVGAPGGGLRGCLGGRPDANCRPWTYGQPELFYNYYVPPTCGGVPAQLYLAPQPVPALVGHTYYTYQPYMPHELLYQHHRTYYRYYNGGRGLTRTSVSWTRPPFTGWTSTLRIAR